MYECSGGKRPSYQNPKKRKVSLDDPYPIGFKGITFRYEEEFGKKVEITVTPIPTKSSTWFNISISRCDYLNIVEAGLDTEWEVTIRHLSNKPVTLRHNHYRKSNINANNIVYNYNINTASLFTNKEMIYQNQITIIDRMYSATIHFWFRISLIDPAINKLDIQLLSDAGNTTSIPHPFRFNKNIFLMFDSLDPSSRSTILSTIAVAVAIAMAVFLSSQKQKHTEIQHDLSI